MDKGPLMLWETTMLPIVVTVCSAEDVFVRRRTMPAADEEMVTVRSGVEGRKVDEVLGGSVMRQPRGRRVDWFGLRVIGVGDETWSGVVGSGEGMMAVVSSGWKRAVCTKGADAGMER